MNTIVDFFVDWKIHTCITKTLYPFVKTTHNKPRCVPYNFSKVQEEGDARYMSYVGEV
jgi:hypothetical protein